MDRHERATVESLKSRLEDGAGLVEVRAFGSRARGTAKPDSDLDVFVEVERLTPEIKRRVREAAWEASLEHSLHVATVIFSRDEVECSALRESPLLLEIMRHGVKA